MLTPHSRTLLRSLLATLAVGSACSTTDPGGPDALDVPSFAGTPDDTDQTESLPAGACTVTGTNITRSLAVTDPAILAKFPFSRTLDQIRTSANVGTTQTKTSIFKTWMKTFGSSSAAGDCNDATIDPNHYGLRCPRLPEAKLAGIDPFATTSGVSFLPVGLFNRFDLAPSNGANCGEYRIVYAMQSSNPNIGGRGFFIFEAALPNPRPTLGKAGCLPIARFWQGLTRDTSVTSRAAKLEKLYFTGGAVTGVAPVVQASHYGLASGATGAFTAGQIRSNFFIDVAEWHLREFKLRRICTDPATPATCTLLVDHVTVKANPAEELFAGSHANSAAFRTAFPNQVSTLARTSVATIGMSTSDTFNEFESVSQAGNVVYDAVANAAIRTAITSKLTALGSPLTAKNILDRATTQTCAGCHQVSNGAALGGGLVWPTSLGFVQIDEARRLSPALTTKFLPRRKAVLEQFINASCTPTQMSAVSADDGSLTLGGSPVGAPN